jgi:hypothetical protein
MSAVSDVCSLSPAWQAYHKAQVHVQFLLHLDTYYSCIYTPCHAIAGAAIWGTTILEYQIQVITLALENVQLAKKKLFY